MNFTKLPIKGCNLIKFDKFKDSRGDFVKTFNENVFTENGLMLNMKEEFYSLSDKDVIRGMHFQNPPADHEKFVYCASGAILDVILDIRSESETYGQFYSVELNDENCLALWLPKGIAHGFLSLKKNSLMIYKTSSVHDPEYDTGIKWNSFGFNWPIKKPIISKRDDAFSDFNKPRLTKGYER